MGHRASASPASMLLLLPAALLASLSPSLALSLESHSAAPRGASLAFAPTSAARTLSHTRALTSHCSSRLLTTPLSTHSISPFTKKAAARAPRPHTAPTTALNMAAAAPAAAGLARFVGTPDVLFNTLFLALAGTAALLKLVDRDGSDAAKEKAPEGVRSLQIRFLVVFWLLRMADWLQGPYFYEVYASKLIGGKPVSLDLVSKLFLIGFGTTGLFGPSVGKIVDSKGRKAGTLAFCILYTIGALSVRSPLLGVLVLGRLAGGIGTSLLFSAPESWLVGEHIKGGYDGKWLSQTFGWAYAGDSLVAITAGQLAGLAAAARGPAGPFEISVAFLAVGALISFFKWKENKAPSESKDGPTIPESWKVMTSSRKIMLVGAVQSLFEGAMYIFVLQWPPSLIAVVNGQVPFGKVFSCFMASCLLGSTLFSALSRRGVAVEAATSGMLVAAAVSMGVAATCSSSLASVVAAFLVFELCVGMYFPSIGTLRSKHLPDSHRSVIVNLFGVPLNLIVVTVFLSIKRLGVQGALMCSTVALSLAAVAQILLMLDVTKPTDPPPAIEGDAPAS